MAERGGIRGRIVLLVTVGAFAPLAALGLFASSRIGRLQEQLADERQRLAGTLAERVGSALEHEMAALSGIASDARFGSGTHDRALLNDVVARSTVLERAFVASKGSTVVEPDGAVPSCAGPAGSPWPRVPVMEAVPGQLCLLVPVEGGGRRVLIGGVIDAGAPAWVALLNVPGPGPASATLAGPHGRDGRAAPVEAAAGGGPADEVTTAALPFAGWRLVLRDPAAAGAGPLRARALAAFALIAPLVLVFAWGAARSVTRPLATLGEAAGRIAVGHIEEPLPDLGSDEVGRLGRAMEAMRQALEHALEAAARANTRLEERVEERTRELERLNGELRERERARGQLLGKVITAQEEERKRIARELHDESCQTLSVLAMKLDDLRSRLADPSAAEAVAAARALAVRTLDDVHRLIFDLRPAMLDDLGLQAALRWLVTRHLEQAGVAVRMEMSPLEARLPPGTETAMFRAAQEVVTNVARHAGATSVLVQVGREGQELVIEIEDDGRGFDPAAFAELAPSGRGLGLLGIRERMELLGGSAQVESAPGEGTRVVLRAPLASGTAWLASV